MFRNEELALITDDIISLKEGISALTTGYTDSELDDIKEAYDDLSSAISYYIDTYYRETTDVIARLLEVVSAPIGEFSRSDLAEFEEFRMTYKALESINTHMNEHGTGYDADCIREALKNLVYVVAEYASHCIADESGTSLANIIACLLGLEVNIEEWISDEPWIGLFDYASEYNCGPFNWFFDKCPWIFGADLFWDFMFKFVTVAKNGSLGD